MTVAQRCVPPLERCCCWKAAPFRSWRVHALAAVAGRGAAWRRASGVGVSRLAGQRSVDPAVARIPEAARLCAHAGSRAQSRPEAGVEADMLDRIEEVYERHGKRKLSLSAGAGRIYARQLAKRVPDKVRSVISLGSPFTGSPKRPMPGRSTSSPRASGSTTATTTSPGRCRIRRRCRPRRSSAVPTASAPGRPASTREGPGREHRGLRQPLAGSAIILGCMPWPHRLRSRGSGPSSTAPGWKSLVYPDWRRS